MDKRPMLYRILYALAARGGREAALFGGCAPRACDAFERSLVGTAFPEVWFEVPLLGDPWFDLHVLTDRNTVGPADEFLPKNTGGHPEAFAWFASQDRRVRQLALSWDVSTSSAGELAEPAVQLLVRGQNGKTTCNFLETVGRADAASSYRAFIDRMPKGWFACYAGVFPSRPGHHLRVECIPNGEQQRAYARDGTLLEEHLHQVGFSSLGDTTIRYCTTLARTPFKLEFQFDVESDGIVGPTLGASVRFACPPGTSDFKPFKTEGEAGNLMRRVESWGLADDRWRLLEKTAFVQRLSKDGESHTFYSYPAFLKLRWRDGQPLDAKAYLILGESCE